MEPVKIGVIGCGVIGPHHLSGASTSDLVDVVAVADLIEERGKAAAEKFGVPKVYLEGDDLIEDPDIEAVVLALPACWRGKLAMHAFARGKHVLTEKPVGMSAAEVQQMIVASESDASAGLVAACCSSRYRFPEGADKAMELIASGLLGELREIHCRCFSQAAPPPQAPPPPWRLKKAMNAGGYLCNWGCYDLDYLLGITGWALKPQTVFAQTWPVSPVFAPNVAPGSDAETHFTALIRCEGGTIISFERGEYMPAHGENCWQIIGTKGTLNLHMVTENPKKIVFDEAVYDQGVVTSTIWEADETAARVHAGPITDFAEAIRTGRAPKTSLKQALVVAKITDAIYASAAQGCSVQI
jgi:predicted dehydrogenase